MGDSNESQDPATEIRLLCERAHQAFDAGNLKQARDLYKRALSLDNQRRLLPDEERMIVRETLAICFYKLQDYHVAESYDRESLRLLELPESTFTPDDEQVTRIRHNLARDLSAIHDHNSTEVDKLKEAINLHRQNMQILKSRQSTDDLWETQSSLAYDLLNLARCHSDRGKAKATLEEAAAFGKKLVDAMEPVFGNTRDARLIEARHNYSSALFQLRRFQEAKELFLKNEQVLQALPETGRTNHKVRLPITRRFIEACNEATMDLGSSLSRRSTGLKETPKNDLAHATNALKATSRPAITMTAPQGEKSRSENDLSRANANVVIHNSAPKADHKRAGSSETLKIPTTAAHHIRKLKSVEHLGRDGIEHQRRSRSASDAGTTTGGRLFQGAFAAGNDADRWFKELWEHTHSVLSYDDLKTSRERVRVAILDSGLNRPVDRTKGRADVKRYWHRLKEYRGRSASQDWHDTDKEQHGTNCVSLLLQTAPEADVLVANVITASDGKPDSQLVSDGLKWAIERKADVISMSLGFDTVIDEISDLIDVARQRKILVFAAASNDGDFDQEHGVFPAWLPTVFCIKSTKGSGMASDFNPQLTTEKSNFMFLGEDIRIAGVQDVVRLSGNSFATAIAAATAALVLDLPRINKNATKEHPRVDRLLRKYEGMSAIFKAMSGTNPPGILYYNVRPWRLLREKKQSPPIPGVPDAPDASKQWYAYLAVTGILEQRFGTVWGADK